MSLLDVHFGRSSGVTLTTIPALMPRAAAVIKRSMECLTVSRCLWNDWKKEFRQGFPLKLGAECGGGFFAKLTRRRPKRGEFHSVVDLQAAINRFVNEHNRNPKPFVWRAEQQRSKGSDKAAPKSHGSTTASRTCRPFAPGNPAASLEDFVSAAYTRALVDGPSLPISTDESSITRTNAFFGWMLAYSCRLCCHSYIFR